MATNPENRTPLARDLALRDVVLGVLSLAAKRGRTRVPISLFFQGFADLADHFGNRLPSLSFTRTPDFAYSKRLEDALQSLVGYSVKFSDPGLRCIEVPEDAADRHITWLQEKYDAGHINSLRPIADRFVEQLCSRLGV